MGCGRPGHPHRWPDLCPRTDRSARPPPPRALASSTNAVSATFTTHLLGEASCSTSHDRPARIGRPTGQLLLAHSAAQERFRTRPVAAAQRLRPKRRLSNCAGQPNRRCAREGRSRPIAFWFRAIQWGWSGSPGSLPSRGPHGSGHARLTHPALRDTAFATRGARDSASAAGNAAEAETSRPRRGRAG
jgi:hypothetical protein